MSATTEKLRLKIVEAHSPDFQEGDVFAVDLIQEIRHLPHRRRVWRGTCDGRDVLVKVFFPHRKQRRDVGREWDSSILLAKNGVLVPEPILKGETESGDIAVVYQFIYNATELHQVIKTEGDALINEAIQQLVGIHGRQHELGVFQNDDHLSNYMWVDGKLYVIDAGSILIKKAPLAVSTRVKNMAKLLANTPYLLRERLWAEMRKSSIFTGSIQDRDGYFRHIESRIPKEIKLRLARYMRKTRRASEEFIHQQDKSQTYHAWREMGVAEQSSFLRDPESTNPELGVGKNYPKKSALSLWLSGSRHQQALNEWSLGHSLLNFKIPAARPLLCVLEKDGADYDYLLLEKINGRCLAEMTSDELLADDAEVARQLAIRLLQLSDMGCCYKEMSAKDFVHDFSHEPKGILRIAGVGGISLTSSAGYSDPITFAANELLPEEVDSVTKASFLKAMEEEVSQSE